MFTQPTRRMKNLSPRFSTYGLPVLFFMLLVAPAASAQTERVIDDFTTGAYEVTLRTGDDQNAQTGSPDHLVGGTRCTFFGFRGADNPLDQPATLDIRNGYLVVDTGVEVPHGLDLLYGYDADCEIAPLNLDLRPFNRFRVRFRFLDLQSTVSIRLDTPAGSASLLKETVPGRNFDVDLPFADFIGTADFGNISHITIVTDSRGPLASHDYAITSIKAVP